MVTLRKVIKSLFVLAWLVAVFRVLLAFLQHDIWGVFPIYAHNHVQGVLGWSIFIGVLLGVLLLVLKAPKKS